MSILKWETVWLEVDVNPTGTDEVLGCRSRDTNSVKISTSSQWTTALNKISDMPPVTLMIKKIKFYNVLPYFHMLTKIGYIFFMFGTSTFLNHHFYFQQFFKDYSSCFVLWNHSKF